LIGSLVLRSHEAQAASGAVQGLMAYGAATASAVPAVAAVFLTPVVLGKIASNPKAVDALLGLNAKSMSAKYAGNVLATSQLAEEGITSIINTYFSEEDKAEVRQELRGL